MCAWSCSCFQWHSWVNERSIQFKGNTNRAQDAKLHLVLKLGSYLPFGKSLPPSTPDFPAPRRGGEPMVWSDSDKDRALLRVITLCEKQNDFCCVANVGWSSLKCFWNGLRSFPDADPTMYIYMYIYILLTSMLAVRVCSTVCKRWQGRSASY